MEMSRYVRYDDSRIRELRSGADVRLVVVAQAGVMADKSRHNMRVSDADRAATAQRIADALGEGRLTTDEADERLAACWSARYESDLDDLTGDLPMPEPELAPMPTQSAPVARGVWSGPLLAHAGLAALVSTLLIVRWAVVPDFAGPPFGGPGPGRFAAEHTDFFWPIFPIFWIVLSVAVHYGIRVRRARQLGG
jgi:uncharacterized protein DUF1707